MSKNFDLKYFRSLNTILDEWNSEEDERAARAKPSYLSGCGKVLAALYRSGELGEFFNWLTTAFLS